jgi:hypothetical protein
MVLNSNTNNNIHNYFGFIIAISIMLIFSHFLFTGTISDEGMNGNENIPVFDGIDSFEFMDTFGTQSRSSTKIDGISQWDAEVLASYNTKTSGCTIGDLDPTRDGNEIVTVNGDGLVAMVYKSESGQWRSIDLWQGEGELITPVIADCYPDNPGNELVVVGMAKGPEGEGAGQATMIYGSGDNWNSAIIYIAPDMLHGLAIGDLDPNHAGSEIVTMSFGFDVEMLTPNGTGPTDWTVTHMWKGEGKVRKGIIDDVDPNHAGNELVVVDKSGNCTMLYGSDKNWTAQNLWIDPGVPGLARIAVGDVDPSAPGKEIIVGGDSNNVGIIWREGTNWDGEVIFTDSDKIRGLGIADVDPSHKGNEILVFGYSTNVNMLVKSGSLWTSRVIFSDTGRSHDLAVGEADSAHPGPEIIIAGYSKNITMISVSPWYYKVLSSYISKTSGCTFGDLDPTRDGNEIVTVNGDGLVSMIFQTETGAWDDIELWQGEGELITPVIADCYPDNPGNELVVVGMAKGPEGEGAGQATMIYGSGDNWKSAIIYTAPDMLHGLAIGDLDPNHEGNEIITMSFGFDVEILTPNGTGPTDWTVTHMWKGEGKVRKGIIDDVDPNHKGNELVVVDKSGNCTMLYGSGTDWTAQTLWTDPGVPGLARVAVGEVDPTIPGKEVIVGGDSNNVGIIWREGNNWKGEVIFTDTDKIRGLGIGDVDPKHPGNEVLVFGYSTNVNMLIKTGSTWTSEILFSDTGRSHDLALGEFYSEHKGQELIIAGYSKNITMVFNSGSAERPDFSVYAYPTEQAVDSGTKAEFNIGVLSLGGFNEPVTFSVSGLPTDLSASFSPTTIIPDSVSTLELELPFTTSDKDVDLKVTVSSSEISHELDLKLKILGDSELPEVVRTFPEKNAEDLPPGTPVVIWFSKPMDASTLTTGAISIKVEDSGKEYSGDIQIDQTSNSIIISNIESSGESLPYSKVVVVSLETSIADQAGNSLAEKYTFKFQIMEKDTVSGSEPNIKDVYPTEEASGVTIKTPIIVQFTIPMDKETLNSDNIKISDSVGNEYSGSISYDENTLTMTISDIQTTDRAQTGFTEDSTISVKLTTGIKTIADIPLSGDYNWEFETGEAEHEHEGDDSTISSTTAFAIIGVLVVIIILLILVMAFSKRSSEPETKKPVKKSSISSKKREE